MTQNQHSDAGTQEGARIRVRARAVDMLGRQQIAGIPSAVHELFKNAYDAFARRVEVDVVRKHRLFLLRDDGYGMTYEDFTGRWLTVGTESKVGMRESTAPWLGEYGKEPRRVLGEKGIGRLAIAVIGPAVLVLTRASRPEGLHDTVVALIHWGLFEIPGIDLDRIVIPVKTIVGGTLPDLNDINVMVDSVLNNLSAIGDAVGAEECRRIRSDLEQMRFSPRELYPSLNGPSVAGDGFGTHFLIRPYDPVLELDLEEEGTPPETRPSKLQTFLAGFSNTMFPDIKAPPILAAFRDHRLGIVPDDLINEKAFLTPDDYLNADHLIEGKFDEYGQFTGTVKVYDRPPVPYSLSFPTLGDAPLRCGSFRIRFGYLAGRGYESLLDSFDFETLNSKLIKYGGLYIYRDGIRVLPYGDIEHDFLRIEQRRNKAMKDWFFAFRRIFGAVLIDSQGNGALQEKAGREGFQENMAYRDFRGVLEHFLMFLAKDYFRETSPLGEEFNRMREEMDIRNELLKKRAKQVKGKKDKLIGTLNEFYERIERGDPKHRAEILGAEFEGRFALIGALDDPDRMGRELQKAELEMREQLDSLRKDYRISRPGGISLSKDGESDWARYRAINAELESTIFSPLQARLDACLAGVLQQRGEAINRRILLRDSLEARRESMTKRVRNEERAARAGLGRAEDQITTGINASFQRFHQDVHNALSDFERTELAALNDTGIVELRSQMERRLEDAAERESRFLSQLREQLDSLTSGVRDGVLPDDVNAAFEGQNVALREELDESLHWAQVGMALGIVQHEFNAVARQVKRDIQQLKPWADSNPPLQQLFGGLHSGFAHLEEYLRMFAPLDRRLYRKHIELSGTEIEGYIGQVFSDRFLRHGIRLECTKSFLSSAILAFPSTLLPVFVNVIDNACYWLRDVPADRKWIRLDRTGEGTVISNGGPGIETRKAERIFEFGFSDKPNGRGMGLSIARRALRRDGFDIRLLNPGIDEFPNFLISEPAGARNESADAHNDGDQSDE